MTGLCGWIGAFRDGPPPEGVLEAMAGGLPASRGAGHHGRAEAAAGLHVRGWPGRCALADHGGLWAGIEGYPRWTSDTLAGLAAERGHDAALIEAYRREGEGLFKHLAGPFSLAVIEPEAGRALLAVDRFGIHTLYYAASPQGGLVFGATADAVRAHPAVDATITARELYTFLFHYVCPAPGTIYREQRKLLPAQYLVFEGGEARSGFYWHMPYREDGPGDADALGQELEALLEQAVRRSVAEEDPAGLGAFLSGGLDSSTVVGLLGRVSGHRPKAVTVRVDRDSYDESSYAQAAARHYDAAYRDYTLTPRDVLDFIPRAAALYDEPFGNSSAIPAYYCARTARDGGIEVMLAGDGGDEIFAGNTRYLEQAVFEIYGRLPTALRSYLLEPIVFGLPLGGLPLFRKARNYITRARTPLPDRLEAYNFWYLTAASEIFDEDVLAEIDAEAPLRLRREVYGRAGSESLVQRLMHLDLTAALADNDLRKVNRMCTLAGVRVRYPFLDEDLAAFSARVPPRLLTQGRRLRDFYKRALGHFLPPETLSKKKHGFGMPFEEWLKEDPKLRELAQDGLRAFRQRHYFKSAFLDRVIEGHGRPQASDTDEIVWDVLMLELWLQAHQGAR